MLCIALYLTRSFSLRSCNSEAVYLSMTFDFCSKGFAQIPNTPKFVVRVNGFNLSVG